MLRLFFDISEKKLTTLKNLKEQFEERFHHKWTSLSVQYHFKAIASKIFSIPFNEVTFHLSHEVRKEQEITFHSYLERLEKEEPLQHVVGETEFMGWPMLCSSAALIPRPETEELVELIVSVVGKKKQNLEILDLCTGTGCIAIAIQKLIPHSKVSALDNFDETIDLAKENCRLNEVEIEIQKIDVLSQSEMLALDSKKYDVWVSNPPYIPNVDKLKMEKNVLDFEPEVALFVPDNVPLLFYTAIAKKASVQLHDNGWLFFEIHENFGKEMIALLEENNFENICLVDDMQGKNRMIYGQKLNK